MSISSDTWEETAIGRLPGVTAARLVYGTWNGNGVTSQRHENAVENGQPPPELTVVDSVHHTTACTVTKQTAKGRSTDSGRDESLAGRLRAGGHSPGDPVTL